MRILVLTLVLFLPFYSYADGTPDGWHWYKESKENEHVISKHQKSYSEKLAQFQKEFDEVKARAVLEPTEDNVRDYIRMQKIMSENAERFTNTWKKTLLDYPELDYTLSHPTQSTANQLSKKQEGDLQEKNLINIAKTDGLIFFFEGSNSIDIAFSKVIVDMAKNYNFNLIPVSMDGNQGPFGAMARKDTGQAEQLNIKNFPAVVLVNTKTRAHERVAFGFTSESDLKKRIISAYTNQIGESDEVVN